MSGLDWRDEGDGVEAADTPFGEYRVRCPGGVFWVAKLNGYTIGNPPFAIIRFARDACQADHDRRAALAQGEKK